MSVALPWSEPAASRAAQQAVFGDAVLVAFAELTPTAWVLAGLAAAGGPSQDAAAGRPLWTAQFPVRTGIPSALAVGGEQAVFELDGRIYAVQPANGSVAWNATSPCVHGGPRIMSSR